MLTFYDVKIVKYDIMQDLHIIILLLKFETTDARVLWYPNSGQYSPNISAIASPGKNIRRRQFDDFLFFP